MKKIIYPENETIAIVHPSLSCPLTIEQIAQKDVPSGVPYLIIEEEVLPEDRTFRYAWTADFSNPDGYGIGAEEWFRRNP